MAQTISISQKELERIAVTMYEGETLVVMLCSVGVTGYTSNSLISDWETVEKVGNGYVRYNAVIGTGSYSGTAGAYVLPDIDAEFTATVPYNYDSVVIYIDGALYPYSVITESAGVALLAGQTQIYRISLRTDD